MAVLQEVAEAPPRTFTVRVQADREAVCIQPAGELDLATLPELRGQVEELLEVGFKQLIVDLGDLAFIDVAGVRLLLALIDQAHHEGCRLSLIQGSGQVRRLCALADSLGRLRLCSAPGLTG